MKFEKTPRNFRRIGLVGAAFVVLIAGLIGATSKFPIGKNTYTAVLEHTAGLRVGEEVQVAGIGVGEVREIEREGTEVRVEFTVDEDIELGKDTVAEVKVATLLGTHFLQIKPQGKGELDDNTIPMEQTRVPFNLQDVINETGNLSQDLDVKRIGEALKTIAETMDASQEEFMPAVRGISRLSAMFARRSDDLGTLLETTSTFSEQIADNTDDITLLMRQANLIFGELTSRRTAIHNLLVDLRTVGQSLTGLMTENRDDVGPMLDNLRGTIRLLTRNHEKLGTVADLLGPMVRYFANATGSGSWLDQYMPEATPDGIRCLEEGNCT